eukprot:scaffold1193_cov159-Ochromonas_danica.AAC.10
MRWTKLRLSQQRKSVNTLKIRVGKGLTFYPPSLQRLCGTEQKADKVDFIPRFSDSGKALLAEGAEEEILSAVVASLSGTSQGLLHHCPALCPLLPFDCIPTSVAVIRPI